MMTGLGMGFGLMGVLMIAFWGGLILLVVLAARALFSGSKPQSTSEHPGAPSSQTARQILDQRYARGEIDREKYELMKTDLG